MKLIIFLSCIIYVNAVIITPGLRTTYSGDKQKKYIGPIKWKGMKKCSSCKCNENYGYPGIVVKENEEIVTNEKHFVRPCPLDDWKCIRSFFSNNSECTPVTGPKLDPLKLAQNTLNFVYANITITFTDMKYYGLYNVKIVDFYYNKVNKYLIFSYEVKNLKGTSPKGYFYYQRTSKEPILLADKASITFDRIIFTQIIPKIPNLCLDYAYTYANVLNGNPRYNIGPKAFKSKDPHVKEAASVLKNKFPVLIREAFLTVSELLSAVFMQTYVCDFGVKVYSV